MASPSLVVADYPIGYTSGFGETLYNLFSGFPSEKLWSAHPAHLAAPQNKKSAESINLPSPARPRWVPQGISLAYYPLLKMQQFRASVHAVQLLGDLVQRKSIKNLLVIPVSPWILSAALSLHKQYSKLNLILFVMDDWQGHHECHGLPYTHWRRRLLSEIVSRANARYAVSREMAAHYEESFGKSWLVAHNGVRNHSVSPPNTAAAEARHVLLTGDVNVFRFDAVISFAEAIQRYNVRHGTSIEFTVMGDIAVEHRSALSAIHAVKILSRRSHSESLDAMKAADLLYLPLAFAKKSSRISLYSLPTKLPEYLASGKNVFFHAPKDSAVYGVAERYDLTPRLATINPEALDAFVEKWATGSENGADSKFKVRRALLEEFDLDRLSSCFQAAFC